jgi:hypothetical protein
MADFPPPTANSVGTYKRKNQIMKSKPLLLAVFVITILAIGCKQSNPANENSTASDTNSMSVTQQLENAREVATNAWTNVKDFMETTKDYTYDEKDAFVASASADLDALDQKIKALSDKAATASDSVKADAQTKLQELRDKRAVLDQKLDAVKNATEADWNDTKTAFQNSYDDVKTSLKQAWQWLNGN